MPLPVRAALIFSFAPQRLTAISTSPEDFFDLPVSAGLPRGITGSGDGDGNLAGHGSP
jgi:hypothetical protein